MLTAILIEAKLNPSYLIGGDVNDFGRGASWTGGELFVVEADESDSTHIQLPLSGTILTNVDIDHLDNFQTFDAIRESFSDFIRKIDGPRVLCIDDPFCAEIARQHGATSYSASTNKPGSTEILNADFSPIMFNSIMDRHNLRFRKISKIKPCDWVSSTSNYVVFTMFVMRSAHW